MEKQSKTSLIVIIILAILAVFGIGFSIFELAQNISLKSDKEKLEQEISALKAKEQESPNTVGDILEYKYDDNFEPGASFNVKLNYVTKELSVEVTHFCSAVDCPSITTKHTTMLTDEEIEKIQKITSKKDYDMGHLSNALESIAKDAEIMYPNNQGTYEAEYDLNKDGKVTRREFGDMFLNSIN